MKRTLATFVILILASCSGPEPEVSVFVDLMDAVARQNGVSFRKAAEAVYSLGYRGTDVWVGTPEWKIRTLDSIGFAHVCAISAIDFCHGDQPDGMENTLEFMKRHSYRRCLLVPGCFSSRPSIRQRDSVIMRVRRFSDMAAAEGLEILIEDYDDTCSPCMDSEDLDHFFASCPNLGHVYDSGNYLYCGEDGTEALKHFMPRIRHMHFKDRTAPGDRRTPPIGTGIVRFHEIMRITRESGYGGWITVEFWEGDMLEGARISIKNIRK